ncbi:L-aspartate oxidase [Candidatus Koribacter versatilis Ellin345]|uniref:L-aspartate oxidase n=1 Tax=Koribacter versatilis (strain Ellin345) TaxID=204669 RepID=Q1IPE9_KORVE|nr:L-aspartate oxidase [Candidatus Koribacter versatilis]ABF41251.1 L-aspartate oxidase [Candidatus Koribacter versatilis Ellin345]
MKQIPSQADFIVIGAGVAGLRASIELAAHGSVLCLAKREVAESNTQYAQGGIAVALSDEDEIGLHLQDTINAGDGLVNAEAARVLVEEGPPRIEELIEWGTQFDRHGTKLSFTREGAHSRNRVLHAHGDSTGQEIGRALYAKASTIPQIQFLEFEFTTELIVEHGRVCGIRVLDAENRARSIRASGVVLATGGLGQVYSDTTNPTVATGDGVAMAYRAGAEISDMEFVQFHPTALYIKGAPRFLLSEALRGEGAYLRNMALHRFMPKYHELAELAPRDVVARAIAHEIELAGSAEAVVYLDLTHLPADRTRSRFPRIYKTCLEYNIDIATDLIPIRPAAHYAMGGVKTDLDGRTTLPGLYAAGECACTGVHGANRLASNSLLEGLVYGARAARTLAMAFAKLETGAAETSVQVNDTPGANEQAEAVLRKVQAAMWRDVGVVREGQRLRAVIAELEALRSEIPAFASRRAWEAANVLDTGLLIARSALAREESRGAHYRTDFPDHRDEFLKHSVVRGDAIVFE